MNQSWAAPPKEILSFLRHAAGFAFVEWKNGKGGLQRKHKNKISFSQASMECNGYPRKDTVVGIVKGKIYQLLISRHPVQLLISTLLSVYDYFLGFTITHNNTKKETYEILREKASESSMNDWMNNKIMTELETSSSGKKPLRFMSIDRVRMQVSSL